MSGQALKHPVDVIGHDAPCEQPVTLVVKMPERVGHHLSDDLAAQPASAVCLVKKAIDLCLVQMVQTDQLCRRQLPVLFASSRANRNTSDPQGLRGTGR